MTVLVRGDRYETDTEYAKRIAYLKQSQINEEAKKKKAERAEYARYLRLKKKYEKE